MGLCHRFLSGVQVTVLHMVGNCCTAKLYPQSLLSVGLDCVNTPQTSGGLLAKGWDGEVIYQSLSIATRSS